MSLPFPNNTIHRLFEEQVEKTPEKIALLFEEQKLTYRELNERANQLAHYLTMHHDICPDTLIGMSLERGVECIVSMLAILKAGGAYVPLDPGYPKERLQFMVQDVIHQTPVQRSILVTSHYSDKTIRGCAIKAGTIILPKQLAYDIPIHIVPAGVETSE